MSGGSGSGLAGSTDFSSFSEKREDGMKVCRGPFNVNCTTSKDPQLTLFEMVKSLELQKVTYKKVIYFIFLLCFLDWIVWTQMLEEQCQIRYGNCPFRQLGQYLYSEVQETGWRNMALQGNFRESTDKYELINNIEQWLSMMR